MTDLTDTGDVREKMLALWRKLDQGKISHTEARVDGLTRIGQIRHCRKNCNPPGEIRGWWG
jgi:hypothetical protein